MKKLILNWLFGTDNIESYMNLLYKSIKHHDECANLIEEHIKTLRQDQNVLKDMLKLIEVCKSHGIDVDKEMRLAERSNDDNKKEEV